MITIREDSKAVTAYEIILRTNIFFWFLVFTSSGHVCVGVSAPPHPEGVSFQVYHHDDEERLLQQREHGADHRLEARQGPEVVGWVAVREESD